MTEHFTRSTVSAAFYCAKCGKVTQHRIDGTRKGPCLDCIAKYDAAKALKLQEPEQQRGLFS